MSAMLENIIELLINDEITSHPAWIGNVSGLKAEKMLRGKRIPYLYLIRAGEHKGEDQIDYYVSFILPDLSIRHQPFVITLRPEGWYYEQGGGGGPFHNDVSIDDVMHLMMHCEQGECKPLISVR